MGYDVHITRADDWSDSENAPISLDEWLAYLETDPSFRQDDVAEATAPSGDGIRYQNRGLAVWTGYSKQDTPVWFDPTDGRVTVKNPDEEILAKMRSVARALKARVLGDEGESYEDRPPVSPAVSATAPARPWWKRVFGG